MDEDIKLWLDKYLIGEAILSRVDIFDLVAEGKLYRIFPG